LGEAFFLASSLLTFAIYSSIFDLLHRFDWDQPFVKLACFEALFVFILLAFFWRRARTKSGAGGGHGDRGTLLSELASRRARSAA
jgi:hypothetical protein